MKTAYVIETDYKQAKHLAKIAAEHGRGVKLDGLLEALVVLHLEQVESGDRKLMFYLARAIYQQFGAEV